MEKNSKVIIIGAGIFGLSLAQQLALEGYNDIIVVDRHVPPVPDGSSNDISRVVRFDYADEDYFKIAFEAYQKWKSPRYAGIFHQTPYILAFSEGGLGKDWVSKTTSVLTKHHRPFNPLPDAETVKRVYPTLTGNLTPQFAGYHNLEAGWVDANKALCQLRDECLDLGVSFVSGHAGTVTGFSTDAQGQITAVRTLKGTSIQGDRFVLAAGAWASSLVPMHNSTLATGQVVGYIQLTESEMQKYEKLPIYANFTSGWFNFPPHKDTKMLKMAVHGWGYTRMPDEKEEAVVRPEGSAPPFFPVHNRPNFVPADGEFRLRQGLIEILPEFANRAFDRLALCWYTDTPTGDFIMDYHPDHQNLLVAGGGSGQ